MERKRQLHYIILVSFIITVLCLLGVSGCTAPVEDKLAPVDIILSAQTAATKAIDPDEDSIRDVNLFVFTSDGFLERAEYFTGPGCSLPLVGGRKYDIYVCANFGYRLKIKTLEELLNLEFHLAYPDDYSTGMPMCGAAKGISAGEGRRIRIALKRLMASIAINIDRSRLSEDVTMGIHSITVGNCPKRCRVFSPSKAESHGECFNIGFRRDDTECAALNHALQDGRSGEIKLYMLENLQGAFPTEISSDQEKVFRPDELLAEVCSYIEMEIEYSSPQHFSRDGFLKYRFYLGETRGDLNVERNCAYHITVTPEGDGLGENSWRVDKSSLSDEVSFKMEPEGYIEVEMGEVLHVGCKFTPPGAKFDIGLEELEEDRQRGIYDYEIDPDGHGVTLTIKGYGTGMLYMEAGSPVDRSGLLYLHVKGSPQNSNIPAQENATIIL